MTCRLVGACLALTIGCSGKDAAESADSGSTGAEPTAKITSPTAGEQIRDGALYVARGLVSDDDDEVTSLIVHWFLGNEETPRECPQGVHPDGEGLTQCDVSFSFDKPMIRLRVQDNDGHEYEDAVVIELVEASAPTVSISEPVSGTEFRETDLITFAGSVTDGEDRPEAMSIWWDSTIDGLLELGSTVDADGNVQGAGSLSVGTHTIRLWAQDTSGRETNAETIVRVFPPQAAPVVGITEPESGTTIEAGDLLLFVASISDERDTPDVMTVSWSSSLDGPLGDVTATSDGRAQLAASTLAIGDHAITVTVTDTDGLNASDTVLVEVTGETTPGSEDTGSED